MPCAKGFNVFYGKLTGAKVAVDFGDLWFDIRHSSKNLLRTIHDRIVSLFCKYSDVVSVRDARMKNLLEEILGRSVIVVPQSVDTLNLFNPNKIDTEQAAELLPHDFQERKIVLYAGTVSREKGCQHIVPLAKDVVFRYDLTNVGFMIVGDGNYLSEMRRETARWGLSEYFHFVGRVPRSLLPVYISLATVTLSLQSHYPAKAIYYMAMGKPVIAVNGHSGTSEIVKHGKTGLIVQLDDLSEKLALLLADSDIAQHMGEQAREDACNNFDCKVIASNYLKLME